MDIPTHIKIAPGLIEIAYKGKVYAQSITGYRIDGQPATMKDIPWAVLYLMAKETQDEAML